jgi:hypothetical protein
MKSIFNPITSQGLVPGEARFKDKRIAKRFDFMKADMKKESSSVINQITLGHAQRQAGYRLMHNASFRGEEIIRDFQSECIRACLGRNLLVVGDTSEFTLKKQMSHLKDRNDVGLLSDNRTPGFFVHANMALDADTGVGLGMSDLLIWTRKKQKQPKGKTTDLAATKKESYKWQLGINNSEQVLTNAKSVTYVFDREADQYDLFKMVMQLGEERHLITRIYQDRYIVKSDADSDNREFISSLITQTPISHRYEFDVSGKNRRNISRRKEEKRQARMAQMELRYTQISLPPPVAQCQEAEPLTLWIVDAIESEHSVPPGEKPIHWRLITTHPVENIDTALQIIKWYKMRWMIEQLFRLLKSQGFAIEESELGYYSSIVKLTAMSFGVAVEVLQLLLARDQPEQQLDDVYAPPKQVCLKVLNQKYQGKTKRQQNPHDVASLAWASWIIARMGGWKGYDSQGPPGPITFKRGVDKFHIYCEAWEMFNGNRDVCN